MGNLEGGYCKKFKNFRVGVPSAAQKHILCNHCCVSFTHSAFPECFMMSWHCAFYLLVPWIFREKKKNPFYMHSLCVLEYHLVEFAPELSRMMDSNHWWCLSVRRNQKYEPDVCCLSISHSLESCISVHMNKTDSFSGGKSANVLTYHRTEVHTDSGCWSSSCLCSSDSEEPLCGPPGWWRISPCSFIDVYLKLVLMMGPLPP